MPSMDIDSPPATVGQTFQATNEPTTSDAEMPIAMATEEQVHTDESGIEFQSLFQQLGHIVSEDEVSEWLTGDLHDNGYLHLSDDGIVSSVIEQHEESDEESDCEANLQDSAASTISHSTAVNVFDQYLRGFGNRKKCLFIILAF